MKRIITLLINAAVAVIFVSCKDSSKTVETSTGNIPGSLKAGTIYFSTAMKAVTIEAARNLQREKEIGTISIGKKADFVYLQENPFKIDSKKIKDISIYSTVLEGKESPYSIQKINHLNASVFKNKTTT